MSVNNILRRFIREMIKQELREFNSTGTMYASGTTPPRTPRAFSKKNKKKKAGYADGHKDPEVLGLKRAKDPGLRGGTEGKKVGTNKGRKLNSPKN